MFVRFPPRCATATRVDWQHSSLRLGMQDLHLVTWSPTFASNPSKPLQPSKPSLQFEALTKYGIDLTAKAAELDPVIG